MLRPLQDRVVVRRHDTASVTSGGIFIPENFKEKGDTGEVLAVGPGIYDEYGDLTPVKVKVGDTILFHKLAGHVVEVDKVEYLLLKNSDIFGVIKF